VYQSKASGKPPITFTGNELRDKEFPPITWAVPDLLPAGVTLFGGREKMGKSWLAFSLCIAVATGGYALGKVPVEQGEALYLSLEDPERRLHKRVRRLARQETDLSRFHYATEWSPADRGGVRDLDAWLSEHPACRVVVGDTLKRIRPMTNGRRNMYDEDYEAVQPFVSLAAKHNVAIVLIHHLNQQAEPHDPFDAFSGSAGLTAAAEGIWLLTRKRGDADAYLMVDGKDIEEPQELALGWDAATCSWTAQGDAQTYRLNKERREIVELLEREDEPMGPKEVADALEREYEPTRRMMNRMHEAGQLNKEGYGKYAPARGPSPTSPTSPTSTNGSSGTTRTSRTPPLMESPHSVNVAPPRQASFSDERDSQQGLATLAGSEEQQGEVVELRPDNLSSSSAEPPSGGPPGGASVRLQNDVVGEEVAEFLRNPPEWLRNQLPKCRANPEQMLNTTASNVATVIYGSPWHWREVVPALREHLAKLP
jgi:AAA domain